MVIVSARRQRILEKRAQRKTDAQEREYRALYPHLTDAEYTQLFGRQAP